MECPARNSNDNNASYLLPYTWTFRCVFPRFSFAIVLTPIIQEQMMKTIAHGISTLSLRC